MNYKKWTIWIFVILLLIVAMMIAFPADWMLGLGTVLLPILIFIQAIIILRANEQSRKKFSDGDWYEDR